MSEERYAYFLRILDQKEGTVILEEDPLNPLKEGETKIGRAADNDIVLDEKYGTVSRHHGKIVVEGERCYYMDVGSLCGSYLVMVDRKKPIRLKKNEEYPIQDNTVIRIGGGKSKRKKPVCDIKFIKKKIGVTRDWD